LTVDIDLAGFTPTGVTEHVTMDDPDLQAINTANAPDRVVPRRGKGLALRDGAVKGRLAPRSYHVLRVGV
jgi:alpha-N-arabinofuranosidase